MTINGILTTYIAGHEKSQYVLHQRGNNLILAAMRHSTELTLDGITALIWYQPKKSLYDHINDLTTMYDHMKNCHPELGKKWKPLYHFTI